MHYVVRMGKANHSQSFLFLQTNRVISLENKRGINFNHPRLTPRLAQIVQVSSFLPG